MCTATHLECASVHAGGTMAYLAELLCESSPLFAQVDTADLRNLVAAATHREVKARKLVCKKGDPGQELFIVMRGKLKVRATSSDGKESILAYLEEGDVFGEMALLDGQPRSADVLSVQDSELLVIHRNRFLSFLASRPQACLGIMASLSQRLRKTSEQLEDMRFLDLKTRLAKMLHQLAQEHGRTVAGGGIRIDLRISQEELGALVGATRENINKLLRGWVDEEILETSQSTVIIRHPDKLL